MVLNKTLIISGCLCLTLLGTACQGNGKQSAGKELKEQADVQRPVGELQFPFPEIPSMLTDPSDRKAYLLKHYWDDFNFSDTALVNCRDLTEQGFVNYVALLAEENTSHALAEESMAHLCTRMLTDVHASKVMTEMVDAYLYNPNSPYYNESLYALFSVRWLKVLPWMKPGKAGIALNWNCWDGIIPERKLQPLLTGLPTERSVVYSRLR